MNMTDEELHALLPTLTRDNTEMYMSRLAMSIHTLFMHLVEHFNLT